MAESLCDLASGSLYCVLLLKYRRVAEQLVHLWSRPVQSSQTLGLLAAIEIDHSQPRPGLVRLLVIC